VNARRKDTEKIHDHIIQDVLMLATKSFYPIKNNHLHIVVTFFDNQIYEAGCSCLDSGGILSEGRQSHGGFVFD
jgi:hypothetical protein